MAAGLISRLEAFGNTVADDLAKAGADLHQPASWEVERVRSIDAMAWKVQTRLVETHILHADARSKQANERKESNTKRRTAPTKEEKIQMSIDRLVEGGHVPLKIENDKSTTYRCERCGMHVGATWLKIWSELDQGCAADATESRRRERTQAAGERRATEEAAGVRRAGKDIHMTSTHNTALGRMLQKRTPSTDRGGGGASEDKRDPTQPALPAKKAKMLNATGGEAKRGGRDDQSSGNSAEERGHLEDDQRPHDHHGEAETINFGFDDEDGHTQSEGEDRANGSGEVKPADARPRQEGDNRTGLDDAVPGCDCEQRGPERLKKGKGDQSSSHAEDDDRRGNKCEETEGDPGAQPAEAQGPLSEAKKIVQGRDGERTNGTNGCVDHQGQENGESAKRRNADPQAHEKAADFRTSAAARKGMTPLDYLLECAKGSERPAQYRPKPQEDRGKCTEREQRDKRRRIDEAVACQPGEKADHVGHKGTERRAESRSRQQLIESLKKGGNHKHDEDDTKRDCGRETQGEAAGRNEQRREGERRPTSSTVHHAPHQRRHEEHGPHIAQGAKVGGAETSATCSAEIRSQHDDATTRQEAATESHDGGQQTDQNREERQSSRHDGHQQINCGDVDERSGNHGRPPAKRRRTAEDEGQRIVQYNGRQLHPSHMYGFSRGILWCWNCGAWCQNYTRSMVEECAKKPTRACADALARLAKGMTPRTTMKRWPMPLALQPETIPIVPSPYMGRIRKRVTV